MIPKVIRVLLSSNPEKNAFRIRITYYHHSGDKPSEQILFSIICFRRNTFKNNTTGPTVLLYFPDCFVIALPKNCNFQINIVLSITLWRLIAISTYVTAKGVSWASSRTIPPSKMCCPAAKGGVMRGDNVLLIVVSSLRIRYLLCRRFIIFLLCMCTIQPSLVVPSNKNEGGLQCQTGSSSIIRR